jgi:hypothetical protein
MPTTLHFSFDLASRDCAVQGRQQQHGRALDLLEDMDAQDHTRPDFVRCFGSPPFTSLIDDQIFHLWQSPAFCAVSPEFLFSFAQTQLWNN